MTTVIDLPQALELLRQARDERGSLYRYQDDFEGACAYAGTPRDAEEVAAGCLIGVALSRAGVPVATLQELSGTINRLAGWMYLDGDEDEADDPDPDDLDAYVQGEFCDTYESELLGTSVPVELTENATRVWTAAQRQQDTGATWGEAVAFAEQVAAALESVTLTQAEVTE
jgi:hypothetical protein